jgi:hypothetical protein
MLIGRLNSNRDAFKMQKKRLYLSAVLVSLYFSAPAFAQQYMCKSGPTNLSRGFDDAMGSLTVKVGKSCGRQMNSANFLPTNVVVVEAPRHGKITIHSRNSWSYVANKNYEGLDQFKIRYVGQISNSQNAQSYSREFMGIRYSVRVEQ